MLTWITSKLSPPRHKNNNARRESLNSVFDSIEPVFAASDEPSKTSNSRKNSIVSEAIASITTTATASDKATTSFSVGTSQTANNNNNKYLWQHSQTLKETLKYVALYEKYPNLIIEKQSHPSLYGKIFTGKLFTIERDDIVTETVSIKVTDLGKHDAVLRLRPVCDNVIRECAVLNALHQSSSSSLCHYDSYLTSMDNKETTKLRNADGSEHNNDATQGIVQLLDSFTDGQYHYTVEQWSGTDCMDLMIQLDSPACLQEPVALPLQIFLQNSRVLVRDQPVVVGVGTTAEKKDSDTNNNNNSRNNNNAKTSNNNNTSNTTDSLMNSAPTRLLVHSSAVPRGDTSNNNEVRALTEPFARYLFRQMLDIVAQLHQKHFLAHLDLSLENFCFRCSAVPQSVKDETKGTKGTPINNINNNSATAMTVTNSGESFAGEITLIDFGLAAFHPLKRAVLTTAQPQSNTQQLFNSGSNSSITSLIGGYDTTTNHLRVAGRDYLSMPNRTAQESGAKFLCLPVQGQCIPGKLYSMSPELYRRTHLWDAFANDIYSLGCILYILLTGERAYQQPCLHSDSRFAAMFSGKWLNPRYQTSHPRFHAVYKSLSHEVLDLIDRILKPESQRLTLTQIREHPWLRQHQRQNKETETTATTAPTVTMS
jgi:hypothetical protein